MTHKLFVHPRIEREHFNQIAEIDRAAYNQEPDETTLSWAERKPWMYTVLTVGKQVQGYGVVIPVNHFAHEALKRGEMAENELRLKYIALPDEASGLFIASIAASLKAHSVISSRLAGYVNGSILKVPKEVFAITVSRNGDSMAREIGMQELPYQGPFKGLDDYVATLFVKQPFEMRDN